MSLCEKDCKYNGYILDIKKVNCTCNIKLEMPLLSNIIINKEKLIYNFKNIKNSFNFEIMKCINILFTKDGIINNIGNYIISSILLLNIVNSILFIYKGYKYLNETVDNIIIKKQSLCNENKKNKIKKKKKIINLNKRKKNKKINILKTNADISNKYSSEFRNFNNQNNINIINLKQNNYNEYELNSLTYKKPLLIDNRNYINYYFSLMKRKISIIFAFYTKNDYNSRNIKISLFLFYFSLFYTVNAIFYNDTIMHQIYINKGEFKFIYQLPQILFSTIISGIINSIISYLSLIESNILKLKRMAN